MTQQPNVKAFFDKNTNTFSYVVSDPQTANVPLLIACWITMLRLPPHRPSMPIR